MYVCRYAEQFECGCDFVICQDCYNKNNNTRSRQHNTANTQNLNNNMFNPLLNEQTGEVRCVGNRVEYHKLQYLKMSDSAHIWIPSRQIFFGQNCKRKKKRKNYKIIFPSECCKICYKKFEVESFRQKNMVTIC